MEEITLNYDIRRVSNEEAKAFLIAEHAPRTEIFIRDQDVWYASFLGDRIVSVNGYTDNGKYIKTGSQFTSPIFRRRYHALNVYRRLLEDVPGREIRTYSRPASARMEEIYLGFVRKHVLKNGTALMVRPGSTSGGLRHKPDFAAIREVLNEKN